MSNLPGPEYLQPRDSGMKIVLAEPDPAWAEDFALEEARIRAALGRAVVELHHVGSTSVPGLSAKPVIDIVLLVEDSADEDFYAPALRRLGYGFYVREAHWHEHRLFKMDGPKVNLHVFTVGSTEAHRMVLFRDWLRTHPEDRDEYEQAKRALAGREWAYVQDYADAKSTVVEQIMERALAG